MIDGLTMSELAAVQDHYGTDRTQEGRTEYGAAYVIALIGQDEDGPITRTVCRERGVVALLDEAGKVVAESEGVADVLAAA